LNLKSDDLKELGLKMGPRNKILRLMKEIESGEK